MAGKTDTKIKEEGESSKWVKAGARLACHPRMPHPTHNPHTSAAPSAAAAPPASLLPHPLRRHHPTPPTRLVGPLLHRNQRQSSSSGGNLLGISEPSLSCSGRTSQRDPLLLHHLRGHRMRQVLCQHQANGRFLEARSLPALAVNAADDPRPCARWLRQADGQVPVRGIVRAA